MIGKSCRIIESGNRVLMVSPAFEYELDTTEQLRAVRIENKYSGRTLKLGDGLEFETDFDNADARIYIDGWKVRDSRKGESAPDLEEGYAGGFFRYDFSDAKWDGCQSPVMFEDFKFDKNQYKWARTHAFIPEKHKGKTITFHVGGIGLLDFGYLRIFINGTEIGTRMTEKRWHEPGCFELDPSSGKYSSLRFGQDNIIAIQLTGYLCRDQKLNRYDPLEGRELATIGRSWPGQFEQYITVGEPLRTPRWEVKERKVSAEGESGGMDVFLQSDAPAFSAVMSYRWNSVDPVLHKSLTIQNDGNETLCLMNVRLGDYRTDMESSEGEQGFPVYLDGCFYLSMAHPSGWVTGQDGCVVMKQYPGTSISPGENFESMETVMGVSLARKARESFIAHIESRMRRIRRGHSGPVSTFDSFGAWPIRPLEVDYGHFPDEKAILHNIGQIEKGYLQDGCPFDYYTIEFWNDYCGDFERPGSERFPHGFDEIKRKLAATGSGLGLWVDTSAGRWSIGGNPVVQKCLTYDYNAYKSETQVALLDKCYCRACEPYGSMLTNGLLHHIRENNVRLFKFDDAMAVCHNPGHDHLPGLYSTEAIQNQEIEMLHILDKECPDIFLVLYWGHRSPWWLLHADTLFESGLFLEASTPASFPTLYARDGVTVTLDQANSWREDIPMLGKDSLGVWLSAWAWNSSIKSERWQESIVMDLCRGSLIYQYWSDYNWLSSDERKQAAIFLELLKQNADCFKNSMPIVGDPWKSEPYGYCCSSGNHAFISINNCTWSDLEIQIELNEQWGMEPDVVWDIYQWYPARLKYKKEDGFKDTAGLSLRPFEVTLIEVVPLGKAPSINQEHKGIPKIEHGLKPMMEHFKEPTVKLPLSLTASGEENALRVVLEDFIANTGEIWENAGEEVHEWVDVPKRIKKTGNPSDYAGYVKSVTRITTVIPAGEATGMLYFSAKMYKNKVLAKLDNLGMHFAVEATLEGERIACEPVIGFLTYAVPWQGWRIPVSVPSHRSRSVELSVTTMLPEETDLEFDGFFIPE